MTHEHSSQFEQDVIVKLTALDTKMDTLIDGETGRIPVLESRVFKLTVGVIVIAVVLFGPEIVKWFL